MRKMLKIKRIKILSVFVIIGSLILSILLSCSREEIFSNSEDSYGNNTELTKQMAKEWYTNNYVPVVKLKTVSTKDKEKSFLVMPSWNHAKEWKNSTCEVVEVTLKPNVSTFILNTNTLEEINLDVDAKKIKNIARMIFLKNKKNGKIKAFNMFIIASYKYMMDEKAQLSHNNYLYRESNFDGSILFYELNGSLINGWQYENGIIEKRISPINNSTNNLRVSTKSTQEECHTEYYSYWQNVCEEYEAPDLSAEFAPVGSIGDVDVTCWQELVTISVEVCPGDSSDTGGVSGGGNTSSPSTPSAEVKNIIDNIYLDNDEIEILNNTLHELLNQCGYKKIYESIIDFDYSFNMIKIDPTINGLGGYDPSTGNLIFRDASDIPQAFPEEFIHLYQDGFYCGISTYLNANCGKSNIEFEAKLFRDILCMMTLNACPKYGEGVTHLDGKYVIWLMNITNGGVEIPTLNEMLNIDSQTGLNYWIALDRFRDGNISEYSGPVDVILTPESIDYLYGEPDCDE